VRLYILSTQEGKVVESVRDQVFEGVHVCYVKGGDWNDARARALQHAQAVGAATIGILVGSCELYHRPHWNGKGDPSKHARINPYNLNGMWMYMERLSRRFAHVYAPSLAALRSWESVRKYPWVYECNPVPACCAVYRVQAVLSSVAKKSGPWGQALCSNGYDSLTMSDFYHHNLGPPVLDETGSATTWKRSYERAINSVC
jgi:hypothetical protein